MLGGKWWERVVSQWDPKTWYILKCPLSGNNKLVAVSSVLFILSPSPLQGTDFEASVAQNSCPLSCQGFFLFGSFLTILEMRLVLCDCHFVPNSWDILWFPKVSLLTRDREKYGCAKLRVLVKNFSIRVLVKQRPWSGGRERRGNKKQLLDCSVLLIDLYIILFITKNWENAIFFKRGV